MNIMNRSLLGILLHVIPDHPSSPDLGSAVSCDGLQVGLRKTTGWYCRRALLWSQCLNFGSFTQVIYPLVI